MARVTTQCAVLQGSANAVAFHYLIALLIPITDNFISGIKDRIDVLRHDMFNLIRHQQHVMSLFDLKRPEHEARR
jgi:hypothetical protein